MKATNLWLLSVLLLIATIGAAWGIAYIMSPKIAYVRSQDLVYRYVGTQKAQAHYDTKKQQWQSNIDTLQSNFQTAKIAYQKSLDQLSEQEQKIKQKQLVHQEQQLHQYVQAIQHQATEEDENMMQGTLNQINAYVQAYAEQQGYDIILGTTLSGSILYGKDAIDITDEVLIYLNQQYQHGQ